MKLRCSVQLALRIRVLVRTVQFAALYANVFLNMNNIKFKCIRAFDERWVLLSMEDIVICNAI